MQQESPKTDPDKPRFVNVNDLRPDDDEDTCLRPLGLCDLGGCCDVCFYNPENQKRRKNQEKSRS